VSQACSQSRRELAVLSAVGRHFVELLKAKHEAVVLLYCFDRRADCRDVVMVLGSFDANTEEFLHIFSYKIIGKDAACRDSAGRILGAVELPRAKNIDLVIAGDRPEKPRQIVLSCRPLVLFMNQVGLNDNAASREELAWLS